MTNCPICPIFHHFLSSRIFLNPRKLYLSKSHSLEESRKPFANGLLSIFSLVICTDRNKEMTNDYDVHTFISPLKRTVSEKKTEIDRNTTQKD